MGGGRGAKKEGLGTIKNHYTRGKYLQGATI